MTLVDELRTAVGVDHVLNAGDLSAWEVDWRGRYRVRALAVVRPVNAAQVAAVVRAGVQHGASLVPQGGNTGLVNGSVPDAGGTLATNAGGTQVLRYGTVRQLCLGLEVVAASGEIWHGIGGLHKDNTGYDLRDLSIDSEGTLGVITGATLKLVPQPAAVGTAMAAVPTLETALTEGCISNAALAASLEQTAAMWRLREGISPAQAAEGLNIKHDIALPVSRTAAFVRETDAALAAVWPGIRIVDFGHLGDGKLHYNVQAAVGVWAFDFLACHEAAVNTVVYEAVRPHGASISAEHGTGVLKRDRLAQTLSSVALQPMRALKAALDPRGTMNPSRVL